MTFFVCFLEFDDKDTTCPSVSSSPPKGRFVGRVVVAFETLRLDDDDDLVGDFSTFLRPDDDIGDLIFFFGGDDMVLGSSAKLKDDEDSSYTIPDIGETM